MANKTYITSQNIKTFARVQNASSYVNRGEVVLAWDELSRSEKNLAKNIDIDDVVIRTSDPRSVPNKWEDNIDKQAASLDAVDFTKQLIANPDRYSVYELLVDHDPPEPLMLWWIDKCFKDPEYFGILGDACWYGMFRGNNEYLWAAMSFGVDSGIGSFRWPSSDKEAPEKKSIKKKIVDELGVPEKEIDILWDDVKGQVHEWVEVTPEEAEFLGVEDKDSPDDDIDDTDDPDEGQQSSLLDL